MTDTDRFLPSFVPPYLLSRLAETDLSVAEFAGRTLAVDLERSQSRARYATGELTAPPRPERERFASGPHRMISDARRTETLPGVQVRVEGEGPVDDVTVNEAYDGLGATFALFSECFGRNSLDGKGLPLEATVHFGVRYDNAFWDGNRMVFGDGDGEIFNRFTASLDVIGHELAHGVTEYTAGLMYRGQSGALNESLSDVFGVLVKQRLLGHTVEQADWLVGADLLTSKVQGKALRSMIAPGTAYDDPRLGRDPQPDHMSRFVETTSDNGGVHINSGIANRAFVVTALELGGHAWERAGQIWYDALTGAGISADCDFDGFAQLCLNAATARYGASSAEVAAVRTGWQSVGVLPAGGPAVTDATPEASQGPQGDLPDAAAEAGRTPQGDLPEAAKEAEVHVERTGGFAGLTRQGHVRLCEVSVGTARQWTALLTNPMVQQPISTQATVRDGFTYHLTCPAFEVDASLPQEHTSAEQRRLMDECLE